MNPILLSREAFLMRPVPTLCVGTGPAVFGVSSRYRNIEDEGLHPENGCRKRGKEIVTKCFWSRRRGYKQ
jgi:hypothetical protein